MKTRKLLAMLLTLAMMMGLLCTGAMATTTLQTGSSVNSITISGAGISDVETPTPQSLSTPYTNYRYINNVLLTSETADNATITITFSPVSGTVISPVPPQGSPGQYFGVVMGNATNTYTVTLSGGNGSTTIYAHHDLAPNHWQDCDIYVINFSKGNYANPVHAGNGLWLRLGDPNYALTAPECYMDFDATNSGYTVEYDGPLGVSSDFYPDKIAFYIDNPENISAMNGSNVTITVYDANYEVWDSGTTLTDPDAMRAGFYELTLADTSSAHTLTIANGNSGNVTLSFYPPKAYGTNGGTAPTSVVSYLPIGQFATGSGWGDADGKYVVTDTSTGYSSTGVSLGAFGGYIEFDFGANGGITNDPRNPYGVDFVVYGNAFNGNPEAGAVQVSEDGSEWYELAGSRYYEATPASNSLTSGFHNAYTGTLRNAAVEYTLKGDGIAASASKGTVTLATAKFTPNTAWWPTATGNAPEYPEFTNYTTDPDGNAHTDTNVKVEYGGDSTNSTLKFKGVTAVQDSDANAFYAFGYADVTPNGNPGTYGDAVNPYTAYSSSKTGGDGFDLEWAVNIATGMPLSANDFYELDSQNQPTSTLKKFRYVRVYSAVLDNYTFGETSTEVCGIFSAYLTDAEKNVSNPTVGVGRTAAPTALSVSVTDEEEEETSVFPLTIPSNRGTASGLSSIVNAAGGVGAETVDISVSAASGANVHVNGTLLSESGSSGVYTGSIPAPTSGQNIRVIVQAGTAAPYLFLYS